MKKGTVNITAPFYFVVYGHVERQRNPDSIGRPYTTVI